MEKFSRAWNLIRHLFNRSATEIIAKELWA